MSGHSKWNNIKNKKGAEDAKRAQVFTNLGKNIRIAAKKGADVNTNPTLRVWVDKAKAANMPKDKIQKAIDVGSGKAGAANVQEITYEGFGPNGVPMMIMAITDNTNRTSGEIRALLTRAGGNLGGPNSASYMFEFDRENQEYKPTMPLEIDGETREKIELLKDDLYAVEGVEGIYLAI